MDREAYFHYSINSSRSRISYLSNINNFIQDSNIYNQANLIVDPIKIYGNETSLWSVKNLSMSTIQDSKFGVVIRLQSHPNYPHRDEAYINAVELRIH